MSGKWKIYIVAHNKILDQMFAHDRLFNNDNYAILNVGGTGCIENDEAYVRINQYELPNSVVLGKWWAESEGIYNVWRSGIWKELDFIGFIHYDKELRLCKRHILPRHNTNITERICRYLEGKEEAHISLETHDMRGDYGQRILADETQPNTLVGDGVNCYDYILKDYNTFFHTSYTIKNLFDREKINLCSCFLIDTKHFDEMMKFWDWIVKSKKLECFDTEHRHRLQGGLAERYFGVYLLFAYPKFLDLSIIHHYNDGLK